MTEEPVVRGSVRPGFEAVLEEFGENFSSRNEVGAGLAIYFRGELVVDLVGGMADPTRKSMWRFDTPGLVFSVTKGPASIAVHLLAQRGVLDLNARVSSYWPEFGANGKESVTVEQLLSHQAGLPVPAQFLSRSELLAGTPVVEMLARQEPLWQPGTAHGYHVLTFGWLVGELVRRVTGRSLGTVLAEEIAGPLGLDLWIGLHRGRASGVARLISGVADPAELDAITDPAVKQGIETVLGLLGDPGSLLARALSTNGVLPLSDAGVWNAPDIHAAEIPAVNGIMTARSLARLYAMCVGEVDGVRLLNRQTVERARAERVRGEDRVVLGENRFGAGFQLHSGMIPLLGENSFGHVGAGGAYGFADVEMSVGFGYVQNRLGTSLLGEPRTAALLDALRKCIG